MGINDLISRFTDELRRDKKRAAILGVLGLVGVVVLVRTVGSGDSLPPPAAAAVAPVVSVGNSADASAKTARLGEDRRDKYIHQIDRKITRDLFEMDPDRFPLAAPVAVVKPAASQPAAPAVDQAELARKAILLQSARLMLQSTAVGDSPSAIINDKVLRVGQSIMEFQVVEIAEGTCVVVKNDVTVRLQMTPKE